MSDCGPLVCRSIALLSEGALPRYIRKNLTCESAGKANVTISAIDDGKSNISGLAISNDEFSQAPIDRDTSKGLREILADIIFNHVSRHMSSGTKARIA